MPGSARTARWPRPPAGPACRSRSPPAPRDPRAEGPDTVASPCPSLVRTRSPTRSFPSPSHDNGPSMRTPALITAAGLLLIAAFQLALAVGAPFGEAAWGRRRSGRLPAGLRVARVGATVLSAIAAFAA